MTRVRSRRAKLWTYFIIGLFLLVVALIVNFAIMAPEQTRKGVDAFFGLPSWAFVAIAGVAGILIYWLGIHIEADWPEYLGAGLIAGAIYALELMIGWETFEFGGFAVIPYIIPLAVFLVLLVLGIIKSP
jgi:hypothetical protein